MFKNGKKSFKNNQAWSFLGIFSPLLSVWMVISLLGLAGCGFHLKGLNQVGLLNFKTVKLSDTGGVREDILRALTLQLKSSGVLVVDRLADAELDIKFQPTEYQASRTSITGQGDAASELLKMSQGFTAQVVSTEQILISSKVTSLRDRRIDTAAALASDRELKSIQKQMAQDVAQQLLSRISRVRVSSPEKPTTPAETQSLP